MFIELIRGGSNTYYSMLALNKETKLHGKSDTREYSNIHVSIFGDSLQFWHRMYLWMINLSLFVSLSNIIFNNNMMKISDIYISTTESILQHINIHRCWRNFQHSMLSHLDFNYNPIDT